jgi:hypothetical protein
MGVAIRWKTGSSDNALHVANFEFHSARIGNCRAELVLTGRVGAPPPPRALPG